MLREKEEGRGREGKEGRKEDRSGREGKEESKSKGRRRKKFVVRISNSLSDGD
ncbi:hypothetical protein H6P81_021677 [Aristolochia fimbriata]|uniref:Uncharacterized protein n=1 Tax=Aristolochia fimbriata TaxID=158543 RepID=A0AAV7DQ92_ARIFI|nr:hypothetical protein H6P81_021677 [Aristolochia fimbriata]